MSKPTVFNVSCPLPSKKGSFVQLAHGGGGKLMHELIESVFLPAFENPFLLQRHDSTSVEVPKGRLAVTTDSYVVNPLFFPGGDIGTLAVNGTVNDLAMSGARPLFLTAAFIIEEGFPIEDLSKIVLSMQKMAQAADIAIIAGDTKVVDRGKGDGVFINTTGIGVIEHDQTISPTAVKSGDSILLCGDIGRHGISIMTKRSGIEFDTTIVSDCASVHLPVQKLLKEGIPLHCLRDLTRGGLATALNEIAFMAGLRFEVEELAIPVREEVRAACEILGFDPLYVANEGAFVAILQATEARRALRLLQEWFPGRETAIIGRVSEATGSIVTLTNSLGTKRVLDMLTGEQLPRIC
ncbi:MAG: hydrogenase expression/formation protein HypE [Deltaproteobacteria bacterium]|nr:hydrogenase expression/formation protein HypE [Deltaproteobacteria bacterium]MBI3294248.1 hydrogenase expression/formation protein HypE [Deltaproteobacteria bacterium]